jgi:hypothetical protein
MPVDPATAQFIRNRESIENIVRRFYLNLQNAIDSLLEEKLISPQTTVRDLQEIIKVELGEEA